MAERTDRVLAGKQIGAYKITALLGAGGMGEVYQAEDTRLGRTVAVKVLPEELARDKERLHRFVREAWAASALNHANVAHIYEIGGVRRRPLHCDGVCRRGKPGAEDARAACPARSLDSVQKKQKASKELTFEALIKIPAMAYSPTQFPGQYHRR